jgi:hypothetical protein
MPPTVPRRPGHQLLESGSALVEEPEATIFNLA